MEGDAGGSGGILGGIAGGGGTIGGGGGDNGGGGDGGAGGDGGDGGGDGGGLGGEGCCGGGDGGCKLSHPQPWKPRAHALIVRMSPHELASDSMQLTMCAVAMCMLASRVSSV